MVEFDFSAKSGFGLNTFGQDRIFEDLGLNDKKSIEKESVHETWWVSDWDESEDLSDIMEQAGDCLDDMFEVYEIEPLKIKSEQRLFVARFELPKYNKELQYSDAKLDGVSECSGWVDFLSGLQVLGAVEILATVGEWSSRQDKEDGYVAAVKGGGGGPAVPKEFFAGYKDDRIIHNYLYLADPDDKKDRDTFVDGVEGEPEPKGLHWWTRINLHDDEKKWPMPGEFFAMAVRQWPECPWGKQETNPYFFAGNWLDTAYLTGGMITEIDEDSQDYPVYTVKWRGDGEGENTYKATSSDFAEYKVGDRVTIIKDVVKAAEKDSQRWKDDDMKEFDKDKWMIAPIIFYEIDGKGEEE